MLTVLFFGLPAQAQIEVFFSPGKDHPGGANSTMKTALINLLNSAKKSIEIAVFSFSDREVIQALNTIRAAGSVTIKVIVDDDNVPVQTSDGAVKLDPSIPVKTDDRPDLEMHDKFVIIDRGDSAASVWTGSPNFSRPNFTTMNNNAVILHSKEIAATFGAEFDQMFTFGKFHTNKTTPSTTTIFTVSGIPVEVRFTPEDLPMNRFVDVVNTLSSSLYFAIFTYGNTTLENAMLGSKSKVQSNNFGWFDKDQTNNVAQQGAIFSDFQAAGFTVGKDDNPDVMHHKFAVIDGSKVFTGSMNFTLDAATKNDENSVFITDAGVAKAYMAELARIANTSIGGVTAADWKESASFGSATTSTTGGTTGAASEASKVSVAIAYPNPFRVDQNATVTLATSPKTTIRSVKIFAPDGKLLTTLMGDGSQALTWNGRNGRGDLLGSGIYFIEIETQNSGTARGMMTLVH